MSKSLPPGWRLMTLDDVAQWGSGGTPKRTEPAFYGGQIPWAVIGDLTDGPVTDTNTCITEAGLAHSSAKWVEPGSILLAMYGSIGKLGFAAIPLTTNQAIAFAQPKDGLSSKYLFWYLRRARDELRNQGKGGTQQNISQTVIKAFPIPVPPLEEQNAIVQEIEKQITRLDAAVAALHRVGTALKRYKASVLHLASSGRLLPVSMTRSTGGSSTLLDGSVAPPDEVGLPPLPDRWIWTRLESLLNSLRNGIFVSRPDADPEGLPIFRISAVRPMSLNVHDVRYAHHVEESRAKQYFVEEGDLLLTRYSGNPDYVGACARVKNLDRRTLHPDKLIRANVRREIVLPTFLEIALSAGSSRSAIRRRVKTTAGQTGISGGDLKSVPVPLPPLEHQEAIVEETEHHLSLADELEVSVKANFRRSKALRQAILDRAFSGQLAPQGHVEGTAAHERVASAL
jgi:type I restriction enzyme, S subunit